MRARSAALLSATVYAAFYLMVAVVASYPVHSPVAVTVVLWSGLVWAAVYEKTRSLVPCVLAHAGANALTIAGTWVIYR
jgi:membrane protease YdiL (CAAX protease family)